MNELLCQRGLALSWASTNAAGTGAAFAQQTCFSVSQWWWAAGPIPGSELSQRSWWGGMGVGEPSKWLMVRIFQGWFYFWSECLVCEKYVFPIIDFLQLSDKIKVPQKAQAAYGKVFAKDTGIWCSCLPRWTQSAGTNTGYSIGLAHPLRSSPCRAVSCLPEISYLFASGWFFPQNGERYNQICAHPSKPLDSSVKKVLWMTSGSVKWFHFEEFCLVEPIEKLVS